MLERLLKADVGLHLPKFPPPATCCTINILKCSEFFCVRRKHLSPLWGNFSLTCVKNTKRKTKCYMTRTSIFIPVHFTARVCFSSINFRYIFGNLKSCNKNVKSCIEINVPQLILLYISLRFTSKSREICVLTVLLNAIHNCI